jgi:hypothetical protein
VRLAPEAEAAIAAATGLHKYPGSVLHLANSDSWRDPRQRERVCCNATIADHRLGR